MKKVKKIEPKELTIIKFLEGYGTIEIYFNSDGLLKNVTITPIIKSASIRMILENRAWSMIREQYKKDGRF